jgi:uncharacterized membrane protein SirB2
MLTEAVLFQTVVRAVHIAAVVVAFGVTFAYPLIGAIGERMDPRAMPWWHRMQHLVGTRLIQPGLGVVLVAGIYLASKEHQWSKFYVIWGLAVTILLGALAGVFFSPTERRLSALAERDIAATASGAEVVLSAEYDALNKRQAIVGAATSVLILVTVYLMTVHTGAQGYA